MNLRSIAGYVFIAVALLVLAGCGGSSARKYAIKVYSGGEVVSTFDASSYSTGGVGITATVANGRTNMVSGTYSVRRTDERAANNNVGVTKYVAELYSGGKVVESLNAYSWTSSSGNILLSVNNTEQVVFNGTYVLRHIGANVDGVADTARYRVTLYDDGVVVKTWSADSYEYSGRRITLKVNGIANAVIVAGDVVVEQIR